ncbi:hypothetical protein FRC17_009522 [Serendipita sp. 399]|nr:hypothetical protein FRC17_009522 [Serendipita sp. 399]
MDDDDDGPPAAALRPHLRPRQGGGETSSYSNLYPTTTTTTTVHDDLNGHNPAVTPLLPPSHSPLALAPWQIAVIISGSFLFFGLCATAWILLRTRRRLQQAGVVPSITSMFSLSRKESDRRWRREGRRASRYLGSGEDPDCPAHKDHDEESARGHDDGRAADRKGRAKHRNNQGKLVETKVKLTKLVKKPPRHFAGLVASSSVIGRSRTTFQTNATDVSHVIPLSAEDDPVIPSAGSVFQPMQMNPSSEREDPGTIDQMGQPYNRSLPFRPSDDWGLRSNSVAHTIRGSFEHEEGHDPQGTPQPLPSPPFTVFDPSPLNRHGPGQGWNSHEEALSSSGDHSSSPPNTGGSLLLHGNRDNADAPDGFRGLAFSGLGLFGSGHYRTNHERTE